MKMLLSPAPFLNPTPLTEETENKTQNGTCGVLLKDTLYALSFSVLQTKRSMRRSVDRSSLASHHPSIQLLPTCGGPAVLLAGRDETATNQIPMVGSAQLHVVACRNTC